MDHCICQTKFKVSPRSYLRIVPLGTWAAADLFIIVLCCHMGAAEGFGTIADQHQRLRSDVGDLVVVFRAEKNDLIFFDDALVALESFNGGLALEHQKGLGGQVIVHIGVVTREKIKYPRTKTVSRRRAGQIAYFPLLAVRMVSLIFANSMVSPFD